MEERRLQRRLRTLGEFLLLAAFVAATLLILDGLLDGFSLRVATEEGLIAFGRALAIAAVFCGLNAVLWPLLLRAMLWVGPALLYVAVMAYSVITLLISIYVVPVAELQGTLATIVTFAVVAVVAAAVSGAIASTHDDAYRVMVMRRERRRLRRRGSQKRYATPGLLCIQIDGLGYDVLRRAARSGHVPHIAELIHSDSHRLIPWETDWSCQTSASQLGIFYGTNRDVPAFRWYDKREKRVVVSNRPEDTLWLETQRTNGNELLKGGASRGNLFTGGAEDTMLVVSQFRGPRMGGGNGYAAYFVDPANATRTTVRFIAEVLRELRQSWRQRRHDFQPRIGRGGLYPLVRAFATVVLTDVAVAAVIGDLIRGRDIIYTDLVGYDEVSHHSGVERPETLDVLRRLDAEIGLLLAVVREVERDYHVIVLSDHGQSQGATFRQRYKESLRELVHRACALPPPEQPLPRHLSGVLTRRRHSALAQNGDEHAGALGRGAETLQFAAAAFHTEADAPEKEQPSTEPIVLASGNLGLVSFPWHPRRATLEWITAHYPGLIPALVDHPGIGFVLVARDNRSSVVLGRHGSVDVNTGEVDGEDPLADYGAFALERVRRTDSFANVPDLMINSVYSPVTEEVAAFEEQVGSHGGLGGEQTRPFLLYPQELPVPGGRLYGAAAIHDVLSAWRSSASS
ncbi:alkaline phosphatase family protein [Hoyosella sp. YIM 151337]|uniref:alkaline phosphatase family protein n=1 Tax=Hoyosella sp. YIM 151337 TaxID=2992742 RepID=UPI0022365D22|nr:alkaline phosphatase family protein [Hoyosella sp. YIM 151337]MCW4353006.1 alkaline phosphatase family protein [Hoyosella sp. YIM 151337]